MSKVGEETSEVLEYIPASFKVLVYVRETWSSATGEIVTGEVNLREIRIADVARGERRSGGTGNRCDLRIEVGNGMACSPPSCRYPRVVLRRFATERQYAPAEVLREHRINRGFD